MTRPETFTVGIEDDGIFISPYDVRLDVAMCQVEQLQDALAERDAELAALKRKYARQTMWAIAWAVLAYWFGVFCHSVVVSVYHYLLQWAA